MILETLAIIGGVCLWILSGYIGKFIVNSLVTNNDADYEAMDIVLGPFILIIAVVGIIISIILWPINVSEDLQKIKKKLKIKN